MIVITLASKSGAVSTIPYQVRSKFVLSDDQTVRLYDLPSEIRDELWSIFNSALQPAYQAGRLGVVVFQFHLSFKPSEEHHAHVLWCRENLDSRYSMAVEFRSRDWFIGEQKSKTESWLTSNGLVLIAADELQHETYQRDREQTGLAPGQQRVVLPLAWPSCHQDFVYIRVHRREGTQRLLSDEELQIWETRLGSHLTPGLKGPIYFMWGTDWEDQPLINARRLSERLPKELIFDWKSMQKINNRLQSMFKAVSSKVQNSANTDESPKFPNNSGCLAPDAGGVGIPEVKKNVENNPTLMGEEAGLHCSSSDQSEDKPRSSPCTPKPSLEGPLSQEPSGGEIKHDEKLGVEPNDEDVVCKKRVALSNSPAEVEHEDLSQSVPESDAHFSPVKQMPKTSSPAEEFQKAISTQPIQVDGGDVSIFVKPVRGNKSQLPKKQTAKKASPAKKRTASTTPAITSFFKRATPKE